MMETNVLIVEDDEEIGQLLSLIVTKAGMKVTRAYSGTEALLQVQANSFDLVLLDLMLPGLSGEAFISRVREESQIPIIVLSAKIHFEDKVAVLKMGADDYITKPFHQEEVLARMDVQLRKQANHRSERVALEWRKLKVMVEQRAVELDGQSLTLTNAEFDLLYLLMRKPNYAFSKREIYEAIWKGTYVGDDNTVSVHISNLRKKLANISNDDYIKTVWGVGFMLI
ncbi:two-component response regulator [Bacillus sp. JCM 19045]|nr:two-component response regulator [Bacillus sp. JCM 19045]